MHFTHQVKQTVIALLFAVSLSSVAVAEPPFGDAPEINLDDLMRKQQDAITIRQAELFHVRLISKCGEVLPADVAIQYLGPLVTRTGRKGQHVEGEPAGILSWSVQRNVVIFSIWLSSVRTQQTVTTCEIEMTKLFVNVAFVDEGNSLDHKFPELGRRSVREVLSLLESPKLKSD